MRRAFGFSLLCLGWANLAVAQVGTTTEPALPSTNTLDSAAITNWDVCNETSYVLRYASAYIRNDRMQAAGWTNIQPGACTTLVTPKASPRFLFAESLPIHRGGVREWKGSVELCATEDNFISDATDNCALKNLETRDFFAVKPTERQTAFIEPGDFGVSAEIAGLPIAIQQDGNWTSRGWWPIEIGQCVKPYDRSLIGTQAHIYALQEDMNEAGEMLPDRRLRSELVTPAPFCIAESRFAALGRENCLEKGYSAVDFRPIASDVDVQVIRLTDADFVSQIVTKIENYVARYLSLEPEAALHLQKEYLAEYGTTLSGMMAVHGMDPAPFLDYVHDVDLAFLKPNPLLRQNIEALSGQKYIFTNGSKGHARNVAGHIELFDLFDGHFGVEDTG